MHPFTAISDWLGLDGSRGEKSNSIRPWNQVPRQRVALIQAAWIAVSIGAFFLLRSEMPADDGFGGYIPLIMATMLLALGITFTERLMLKTSPEG